METPQAKPRVETVQPRALTGTLAAQHDGMYPLLAAGASAVANNLLESLGNVVQRKLNPAAKAGADFAATLNKTGKADASQPRFVAETPEERIANLKARLLQSPELQTAIQSADPSQGVSLSISPTGAVSVTGADGRVSTLTLSPETTALASQLGSALQINSGNTLQTSFPLSTAVQPTLRVYA